MIVSWTNGGVEFTKEVKGHGTIVLVPPDSANISVRIRVHRVWVVGYTFWGRPKKVGEDGKKTKLLKKNFDSAADLRHCFKLTGLVHNEIVNVIDYASLWHAGGNSLRPTCRGRTSSLTGSHRSVDL